MSELGSGDPQHGHGTPSHLSVGGSSGWNTPTPTWTEGTPSFTESTKSGLDLAGGVGQSSLDDLCDVCFGPRDDVTLFYFVLTRVILTHVLFCLLFSHKQFFRENFSERRSGVHLIKLKYNFWHFQRHFLAF